MFGIFKGDFSAMLILECKKAKIHLPDFRLRMIAEQGRPISSVNRTIPSGLFDCRRASESMLFSTVWK